MVFISGYIDSDAFDSEIRHIDSPDNSEMVTSEIQNSESLVGQDLTSIINGEEYDSVREYLENELENTDFTNEIARRSYKKSTKSSTVVEIEVIITKLILIKYTFIKESSLFIILLYLNLYLNI